MTKGTEQGGGNAEGMAALWAEHEGHTDGRRSGLTLPGIVAAALDLADERGLAEVTMATLAGRLGFTTMALYRHIPNKGALQVLMVDAGIGRPPAEIPPDAAWRDQLERLARTIAATYRSHQWLLEITIGQGLALALAIVAVLARDYFLITIALFVWLGASAELRRVLAGDASDPTPVRRATPPHRKLTGPFATPRPPRPILVARLHTPCWAGWRFAGTANPDQSSGQLAT